MTQEEFKNNVTRMLDSKKITFRAHTYDYDAGVHSAVEVAEAIGLPPQQVFKTLVALSADAGHKPMLVVIPGPDTLDLKTLAKVARIKKARMATHDQAESLTGLQTGGISPLALINRGFTVYLDRRAQDFATIAVSAGERGANLEVAVKDLVKLVGARVVDLA
ncbi:MAG: aminoacyl-tRNA deacylase [Caldilineaceae bacterium]|nr:aminoacyl-tRNA deacylase [Caldilineaceae bacterium]MBP8107458.1 aminoacyl-tRNA deacylase [Caldilineaceae bacterium]MBP8122393.1 aminoacyl-tRNA deacylase [Caldilineaceae bacterium]MBP9073557.1 aminoacyl-tRNA deacylase [Caldilineaceae bacterium]